MKEDIKKYMQILSESAHESDYSNPDVSDTVTESELDLEGDVANFESEIDDAVMTFVEAMRQAASSNALGEDDDINQYYQDAVDVLREAASTIKRNMTEIPARRGGIR
jgi:hypothetical protein